MRPNIGGKFCVPAFLAVTTVGAPGCTDKPTTTTSESSTGTSAGTIAVTEPTTTVTPTTGMTTSTDSDNTTGGIPDCHALANEAACKTEPTCFWFAGTNTCVVDCEQIKDQATCVMQQACSWFDEMCELVVE